MSLPSVYNYLDYRAFLRDHFSASKAAKRHYSYRYLARRAGFASSNFLKLVMTGRRNLGPEAVRQVAHALELEGAEAQFFANLVELDQAKSSDQRDRAMVRVTANRRFRKARRLEGPLLEYLENWYLPAIRELAARPDFQDDPRWITAQLMPRVTQAQARRALVTLERLGLLVRDASGRLSRGDPTLKTGHEAASLALFAYHTQMINRAGQALQSVPREWRDFSAQTICIRAATVAKLKERIHRFREEVLAICDEEESPEQVYQLCIQLFPLTKSAGQED